MENRSVETDGKAEDVGGSSLPVICGESTGKITFLWNRK
jgi:hypothetical protein